MSLALRLEDVTVDYPPRNGVSAVRIGPVSLEIAPGLAVGVVGESGSGKSSIARTLLGLARGSTGTLAAFGETFPVSDGRRSRRFRSKVRAVFQDSSSSLNPSFTIRSQMERSFQLANADLGRRAVRSASVAGIEEALDSVGLSNALLDRRPHELSGGQRQRVCIARALLSRPDFLVADEAVSALDVLVQAEVLALLKLLKREGLGMLFISHDLVATAHIADRLLVMRMGEVVEEGAVEDVFGSPRHPYTRELLGATLPLSRHELRGICSGGSAMNHGDLLDPERK